MRARIWSSILVTLLLVPLVAAQVQYAVIAGVVTDSSGAVLPGVSLELTGPDRRSTVSDSRGEFTFVRLQGGEYRLNASLAGFNTVLRYITLAGRANRANCDPIERRFRCRVDYRYGEHAEG
jgi:hypothetical protein